MPEVQLASVIVQAGFCGVLLVVLWYVGHRLIPQHRAEVKELTDGFRAELAAERAARESQHDQCEETHRQNTEVLTGLVAEVKRLADRQRGAP